MRAKEVTEILTKLTKWYEIDLDTVTEIYINAEKISIKYFDIHNNMSTIIEEWL